MFNFIYQCWSGWTTTSICTCVPKNVSWGGWNNVMSIRWWISGQTYCTCEYRQTWWQDSVSFRGYPTVCVCIYVFVCVCIYVCVSVWGGWGGAAYTASTLTRTKYTHNASNKGETQTAGHLLFKNLGLALTADTAHNWKNRTPCQSTTLTFLFMHK